MPGLDALPADQRTVLQLVLRQGRSYDAIARALRLDPAAVRAARPRRPRRPGPARRRSPSATAGASPTGSWASTRTARRPSWRRTARPARWAAALRDELEPVATAGLPRSRTRRPPAAAERHGRRTPPRRPPAARAGRARGGRPPPRLAPRRRPAARGARAPHGHRGRRRRPRPAAATTPSTHSPRAPSTTASASSSSSSSAAAPRVLAQVNLTRAEGRPGAQGARRRAGRRAPGQAGHQRDRPGPPRATKKAGYGIWLLGDGDRKWLGYFRNADQQGRLVAQGQLDQRLNIADYRRLLITKETAEPPRRPGTTYLAGTVDTGAAQRSGGSSTTGSSGSSGSG